MPTNNYLITWDPTNKKWTAIEDGGAAYDLVERPTVEQILFNTYAATPADNLMWLDASGNLQVQLASGKIVDISRGMDLNGTLNMNTNAIDNVSTLGLSADITMGNTMQINGLRDMYGGCLIDSNGLAVVTAYVGEFQWAGTVLKAYAKRLGGTGATVNIQVGGVDIRSANLSLTATTWTDFGALQNTGITDGEDFDLEIASVTGTVTQLAFAVEVERA